MVEEKNKDVVEEETKSDKESEKNKDRETEEQAAEIKVEEKPLDVATETLKNREARNRGLDRDQDEVSRNKSKKANRGEKRPSPATRRSESKRRAGKLTISEALEEREERQASVARYRRKLERERQKTQELRSEGQRVIRDVVIPEGITVQELANRMAERADLRPDLRAVGRHRPAFYHDVGSLFFGRFGTARHLWQRKIADEGQVELAIGVMRCGHLCRLAVICSERQYAISITSLRTLLKSPQCLARQAKRDSPAETRAFVCGKGGVST